MLECTNGFGFRMSARFAKQQGVILRFFVYMEHLEYFVEYLEYFWNIWNIFWNILFLIVYIEYPSGPPLTNNTLPSSYL